MKPLCIRCRIAPVNRPRGLCWVCYYTPGVKELHPITSKFAQCGTGNGCICPPLDNTPTPYPPGSPGKVAVMMRRAEQGLAIFHPGDAWKKSRQRRDRGRFHRRRNVTK